MYGAALLRRAVFLKEAIQAPYLEDLAAIVPHSQYLHHMRQGAGYLAGKRALEAHSGMREPTRRAACPRRRVGNELRSGF